MTFSFGETLIVDLGARTVRFEALEDAELRSYIGGSGIGSRLLARHVPPTADPLEPDNALVFAVGPFCGTPVPTSGRHQVLAKSPLTGIFGECDVGGAWGSAFRATGFDALVITGSSDRPVSLIVREGGASLEDAGDLWGRDTFETYDHYRSRLPGSETACIGPAGERLVRIAAVLHDGRHARAAGRCGIGAVMGSKRLKAVVAVPGRRDPRPVHDAAALSEACAAFAREMPGKTERLVKYGTAGIVVSSQDLGDIPVRNWKEGSFGDRASPLSGQHLAESGRLKKRFFCGRCPIGCGRTVELSDGTLGAGPEYETACMFGSNCLVDDPEAVIAANELSNRLGIDTISAGAAVGFLMESYEKGETAGIDLEGVVPAWGDGRALVELVRKIGERRGVGEILGEGVLRASRVLGRPEYAIHSKGLEFPAHDPRAFNSLALSYATSNRGACHLQGFTYVFEKAVTMPELGFPVAQDRFGTERKAELVIASQDLMGLFDSLKLCKLAMNGGVGATLALEWLNLATGWNMGMDEFLTAGERIFNLKRAYNRALGVSRKDDTLPDRIRFVPKGGGAGDNLPPDLDASLDEYYRLRGWTPEGIPKPETLARLGIGPELR
jgi:aldehyde:ferredoxin oxidoreductase